eukprot:EG_transcript_12408
MQVWDNFIPQNDDRVIVGKQCATRAQCVHCNWNIVFNAFRMHQHYQKYHLAHTLMEGPEEEEHVNEVEPNPSSSMMAPAESPSESSAKRQKTLDTFVERRFSPQEQANAEMAQAFAMVMNGHSYNSLDNVWTRDFIHALRPDYVPLSRKSVQSRIIELEKGVKEQVVLAVKRAGIVSIAVDGWEDYGKFPTLGFTLHPPVGRALLLRFERVLHRETADWLDVAVRKVAQEVKELGAEVAGVIADNAANIQKGVKLSANTMGFVVVNCWSHTLNLLMKDLVGLFQRQFDEVDQLQTFFRNRHQAHIAYAKALEKMGGTVLCDPVDTRWGSNLIVFTWSVDWWDMIANLVQWLNPVLTLIEITEADDVELGRALELSIPVLDVLGPDLAKFGRADLKAAEKCIAHRKEMLHGVAAILANLLHPAFRGRNLSPQQRALALRSVSTFCGGLDAAAVPKTPT